MILAIAIAAFAIVALATLLYITLPSRNLWVKGNES